MKFASKKAKKQRKKDHRAIRKAEQETLAASAVEEKRLVEKVVADKKRKKKGKRVRDNERAKKIRLSNADFNQRRIKHEKSGRIIRSRRSQQAAKIRIGLP